MRSNTARILAAVLVPGTLLGLLFAGAAPASAQQAITPASPGTFQLGACANPVKPLLALQGLDRIDVYERTASSASQPDILHSFGVADNRLRTDIPQSTTRYEFSTDASEYYDVFVSDAQGNLDPGGSYLTIDAYRNNSLQNAATGNNIDGVGLRMQNGTRVWADFVSHVELGTGLSGDHLKNYGNHQSALGAPEKIVTHMGDRQSSITVGFCSPLNDPSVPVCAANTLVSRRQVGVGCITSGQFCSPTAQYPVSVAAGAYASLMYEVDPIHCSSVRLHAFVDGQKVSQGPFMGWMAGNVNGQSWPAGAGPLKTTLPLGFLTPGPHTVSVQAEGRVGGCNVGRLIGWAGKVTVTAPDQCTARPQCSDGADNADPEDTLADAQDPGCIQNGVYNPQDNDETDPAPQGADVSVTKTGPESVVRGSPVHYIITATNNGPAAAQDVVIRDLIPSGFTYPSQTPGCTLSTGQNGTVVVCGGFDLPAGQSRSFALTFATPTMTGCVPSTAQNTATVSSSTTDPVSSNNISQVVTTTVTCPAPQPQCSDGVDNADAEDTLADAQDPGCHADGNPNNPGSYNPNDNDESNPVVPQCSDGIDNDGDGRSDFFDPGCYPNGVFNSVDYNPNDNSEGGDTVFGCIEVTKQALTSAGQPITPVPQFRFTLDGNSPRLNNATGRFTYWNIVPGTHTVSETVPSGWTQIAVSPAGGQVAVAPGTPCAQVHFSNRQLLP